MLELLIATSILACILDSGTTYFCLRKGNGYEANFIFKYIFKFLGIGLGSLMGLAISFYVVYKISYVSEIPQDKILWLLAILTITKTAAAHSNYTKKHNWIIKAIVYLIPVYWDWGKVKRKTIRLIERLKRK